MGKKIFNTALFVILFLFFYSALSYVLRDKTCADRQHPFFYEKENTIDILLTGPSTMDTAISPSDLWNEFGYTSYNLANGGQSIPINYYACKVALKTQSPSLIVLDLGYLFQKDKLAGQPSRLRQFVDNIPWSLEKADCICSLTEMKEWPDYFINVFYYHTRWKSLTKEDFMPISTLSKGFFASSASWGGGVYDPLFVLPENDKKNVKEYEISLQYIDRIKKLCEEADCHFLCINLPSYATGETNHGNGEELQKMWNGFTDYADENGIAYLNMLHHLNEIGICFTEDFYDWRHMNYHGAQKVTSYLGKYIQNNYGLTDHRNDRQYISWQQDYKKFRDAVPKM